MQTFGWLFKVLWSPGETMLLISKSPRVLVPMLPLTLFSIVSSAPLITKLDPGEMAIRAMERQGQGANMSDEQKAQLRRTLNSPVVRGFTLASTIVTLPIMIVIIAGIYFVLFTILGREGGFKAFLSITTFSFVPVVFRQLAAVLAVYLLSPAEIMPDELGSLSPAVFLDRSSVSPVLFTAVSMIDVVTLWILSLLIIGFGFVTRKTLSKATRAVAVVGVFMVYVVLRLGLASLQSLAAR